MRTRDLLLVGAPMLGFLQVLVYAGAGKAAGPVEEFESLGYDEAKAGERFVRIGVGAIQKPEEPRYRQFSTYPIVDPGTWTLIQPSLLS